MIDLESTKENKTYIIVTNWGDYSFKGKVSDIYELEI